MSHETPRELVYRCLRFESPSRVPRDLWLLPWATNRYADRVAEILERFPPDILAAPEVYRRSPREKGWLYGREDYTDEWGCTFHHIEEGVLGEVRDPMLTDLANWASVRPPLEVLPVDPAAARERVNRFCGTARAFVLAPVVARPWERYQFIRGSANALLDVARPDEDMRALLGRIHEFYLREMEFWCSTDVDAVWFMDDWGAQKSLLISPRTWRELFKPFYREYCALAHGRGKFIFMHSDGFILPLYPDLIEVGVDAVNSQLFTMDMAELARTAKGKITFWGEIDRQHVLASPDAAGARDAVRLVARHLFDPRGGVIAQCEFGPGACPATVLAVFEEWERLAG